MSRRKQCSKCPWKVGTDPHEIPGGYCAQKHVNLKKTVARPGELPTSNTLQLMACHESPVGLEQPCVGWLANQLGPGNNIGLRLAVWTGRIGADFELDGEQHERFEESLPRREKRQA